MVRRKGEITDVASTAGWSDVVDRLLDTARSSASIPPTPIDALAHLVGIKKIVREPGLPFSGRLIPIGDSYVVELCSDEHPSRQRFTLGHEIGHILLSTNKARQVGAQFLRCGRDARLEKQCDIISGRLLLPREELCAFLDATGPTIHALKEACKRFEVSWQAMAIRLPELIGSCSFVLWRHEAGGKEGAMAYRVLWSSTPAGTWIPAKAKARDENVIQRSLHTRRTTSGIAVFDLGSLRGEHRVEAMPIGDADKGDVLMLIHHGDQCDVPHEKGPGGRLD